METTIILSGFFRCPCTKLHTRSGIGLGTLCPGCGASLWALVWR